ncbi:MAG: hypothetical protein RJB39_784 [Candidatus Parcubacteria bacterium]|jgi:hypothetical protein
MTKPNTLNNKNLVNKRGLVRQLDKRVMASRYDGGARSARNTSQVQKGKK